MPVFEVGVNGTASSAPPPSPRCADGLVEACSSATRAAGCHTQRHSSGDSSEIGRMLGREGHPKPREKGQVLPTFLGGMLRAILTV